MDISKWNKPGRSLPRIQCQRRSFAVEGRWSMIWSFGWRCYEALTPPFSESCFDALPENISYFTPAVDIAKWTEDVSGAAIPPQDFLFSSPDPQDMSGPDAIELKHDTASVYSMDSAYQSQTGADRRGNTVPEGFQSLTPQDTRSRVSSQFLRSDIYSPTLSPDNFNAFPEQHTDMTQIHLPSAAEEPEIGGIPFGYSNYSAGQDFTQFSTTSVPRTTSASGMDIGSNWVFADSHNFSNSYDFLYPKSSHSLEAALYPSQDPGELMFTNTVPQQRTIRKPPPQLDTNIRSTSVRGSSSFSTNQRDTRPPSTNDPTFGTFVMSPTSSVNVQLSMNTAADFEERRFEIITEKDDTASTSLAARSVNDEDESMSPSDAAEAKNMDDEQGKVARSHPLYQAKPDENGKYHCPNEGKSGCNHVPTTLKCNYDKYVDSHLKPFRCNKKVCVGVQFSSTACLLRHEREAHGMYGHGSRPHLCQYTDCERSLPGNGFPRRYNLFDHMKRVHDWTGPTAELSPPVTTGSTRKHTTRKRRSTADEGTERRHKITKPDPQKQLQQRRQQLKQDFLSKKQSIINMLTNLTGPNDLMEDIQLTKEVILLHDISTEYKKSLG
ncbi:uncharacterized protein BDR25DRAFT_325885 [Lindgomyces ingoldianus]|uniref:Uncharacterized protein n=1 Tax=Lindgomyces ingoldianus TaxID=673940 RepID=A0ACB6QTK5_9PLEO|nr:uncharacterized protein BDR25DRAFT_325885 [Lindgomyces ingoldianus]KAF2470220.1 hypothetical protein BDR25DRAFT_325885 [Lindgomyces ingoldianus]